MEKTHDIRLVNITTFSKLGVMMCKATVSFTDVFGVYSTVFVCQLEEGHTGWHEEKGNLHDMLPYEVRWAPDGARKVCARTKIETEIPKAIDPVGERSGNRKEESWTYEEQDSANAKSKTRSNPTSVTMHSG